MELDDPVPRAKRFSLNKSIQASFGTPNDPDYVFDIAGSWDDSVMGVSLSTREIKLYSPATGQRLGSYSGHTGTITDLQFLDASTPYTFCSSSTDGTIRVWDSRTGQQVNILETGASQELYSFTVGGTSENLICAGARAQIRCWDWRTGEEIACMQECHTEDVTQVRFHPSRRDKLVSASVDGLICVFNTRGEINDDEGLDIVMSVGTSIARIGFHGVSNERLWCMSHIETLNIWNFEEGTMEVNFGDTRLKASANWKMPQVDYLIHCHYSLANNGLWLVAGTNSGILGYFPLSYNTDQGNLVSSSGSIGPVSAILAGGHSDIIRTTWSPVNKEVNALDLQNLFCWTGGEDGRLCSWSEGEADSSKSQSWVSSRLVMRKSRHQKHMHQPY